MELKFKQLAATNLAGCNFSTLTCGWSIQSSFVLPRREIVSNIWKKWRWASGDVKPGTLFVKASRKSSGNFSFILARPRTLLFIWEQVHGHVVQQMIEQNIASLTRNKCAIKTGRNRYTCRDFERKIFCRYWDSIPWVGVQLLHLQPRATGTAFSSGNFAFEGDSLASHQR